MKLYSKDPAIQLWYLAMKRHLQDCKTVLDLGCGKSRLCRMLDKESTGVDAWEDKSEHHGRFFHDDVLNFMKENMRIYDAVIAIDVIEHLPKEKGCHLLNMMQLRARKKIVIYTPNGFMEQGENNGNPLQRHLSGWTIRDFKKHGFEVEGALCHSAFKNSIIRAVTAPFIKNKPESAAALIAVKNLIA